MSNSRIAPIRPSIARILKRQIGGFIREYEREVNRGAEPTKSPPPEKTTEPAPATDKPAQE
ncbi:MAG: hypothetical protein ACP5UQ_04445 [Anaerolineae bacterium]